MGVAHPAETQVSSLNYVLFKPLEVERVKLSASAHSFIDFANQGLGLDLLDELEAMIFKKLPNIGQPNLLLRLLYSKG